MADRCVLVISASGGNDAIRGLMGEFGNALREIGLPVIDLDLESGELNYAVEMMSRGEVAFALTWQGVGQNVSVSVSASDAPASAWDVFRVPLVKIHGDIPAYFAGRHRDLPICSANLYMAPEFAEFRRVWLPDALSLAGVIPPSPMGSIPLDRVDRARREKGALVFLKNGNSAADLAREWQSVLPSSLSRCLLDMSEELEAVGMRSGKLLIGDFAGTFLARRGLDPSTLRPQLVFLAAQLDDYLRRKKSELIARSLLDFPVIIQGNAWNHVDFSGRRATLRPGRDFSTSRQVFAEELGVIDMSPNIDLAPHDRVQRAAGAHALVLTNRQSWMDATVPGFSDLQFEFEPRSIAERVDTVLSNPRAAVERAIEFGEAFRGTYTARQAANTIVRAAEFVALSDVKPHLGSQPYFLWS